MKNYKEASQAMSDVQALIYRLEDEKAELFGLLQEIHDDEKTELVSPLWSKLKGALLKKGSVDG